MTCRIKILTGEEILLDNDDFRWAKEFTWFRAKRRKAVYAMRQLNEGGKRKSFYLHREITKSPKGLVVNHLNGNGLDNRKKNLLVCSNAENIGYRIGLSKNNSSGFTGVHLTPKGYHRQKTKKWIASITVNRIAYHLGRFSRKKDAILERKKAEQKFERNI